MCSIAFGFRTDSLDHPLVSRALEMNREFMSVYSLVREYSLTAESRRLSGPMSNALDMFPILQKFPSTTRVRAAKLHQDLREVYGGYVKDVERKLERGEEVKDCLAKNMIQSNSKEHLTELDMDMMAATFMIGGIETVSLYSLLSFYEY